MFFAQLFILFVATLTGLATASDSSLPTPTLSVVPITAAPITTTSKSISLLDTATVTCLHQVCMHGYSYCWYWPTMEVGIGSFGAEPSFTLAPFATCTESEYQSKSTLDTVTVATSVEAAEGDDASTDDCEEETSSATAACEEDDS